MNSSLPPGEHDYLSILRAIDCGMYRFASLLTASGRCVPVIGVSEEQLQVIRRTAELHRLLIALCGSRVAGPRSWQRQLSPVLSRIPLQQIGRLGSVGIPSTGGICISKTTIKEYGSYSPQSSDLSLVLIDPCSRDFLQLEKDALGIEADLNALGFTFPVRVFASLGGRHFLSEADFVDFGVSLIKRDYNEGCQFSPNELAAAFRDIHAILGYAGQGE